MSHRKLIFFLMKNVIHVFNLKKQKKGICHVLIFILYSIRVHIESLKSKMFCLNSPKSS